jgi:ABC-type multidrug transport system, ATPase component
VSNILEVTGLNKSYGKFSLQDVSFSLQENCITGFIGKNGSGKTTTIRTLLGLAIRDSGNISIFGKSLDENEQELKNRIGVVFDEGYFYEELSVSEMKSIIAPAYKQWDEKTFRAYLDRFELNGKQKISTLSKGMRMKFSLALALSHNAGLLIMDEPTSGLDPLIRSELMDILLEFMKEDGKGVFFSTHITSDLDKAADMIILIDNGKIIFNKDKDSLIDDHGIVKGDRRLLSKDTRKLFLSLEETEYGFTGITNRKNDVRRQMNGVLFEKPSIEDIMLAYIKEGM